MSVSGSAFPLNNPLTALREHNYKSKQTKHTRLRASALCSCEYDFSREFTDTVVCSTHLYIHTHTCVFYTVYIHTHPTRVQSVPPPPSTSKREHPFQMNQPGINQRLTEA